MTTYVMEGICTIRDTLVEWRFVWGFCLGSKRCFRIKYDNTGIKGHPTSQTFVIQNMCMENMVKTQNKTDSEV